MWHRHPRALHSECAHTLGPCQNAPRLPLFLALKRWERAFQNQTEVFANIFWPSCLPIFISFIFGKRKFPDAVLGIRLLSGQPVPVSHFWPLPRQGEATLRPSAPGLPHLRVGGHPAWSGAWRRQLWLPQLLPRSCHCGPSRMSGGAGLSRQLPG